MYYARKDVTTNKKLILKQMGLKFRYYSFSILCKKCFYFFVITRKVSGVKRKLRPFYTQQKYLNKITKML